MGLIKKIVVSALIVLIEVNCSSIQRVQNKAPIELGSIYYKNWVPGIKGGDSGVNLYISIIKKPDYIVMDSVYFKNQRTKLEFVNPTLYVGRFITRTNKQNIIMSNAPYAEYGNKEPKLQQNIPFDLKDDECMVSYLEHNKKIYYKISGIIKKEPIFYPSAPIKKP